MSKIIFIAAVAKSNRVIGNKGKLPWHIPEDLKRFRKNTLEKTIVMGRKTFESLGKPLAHRRNIVLTSKRIDGVECYNKIQDMLHDLKNEMELRIIGGSQIFEDMIDLADQLYITRVDGQYEGDVTFPSFENKFKKTWSALHDGFEFCIYERMNK